MNGRMERRGPGDRWTEVDGYKTGRWMDDFSTPRDTDPRKESPSLIKHPHLPCQPQRQSLPEQISSGRGRARRRQGASQEGQGPHRRLVSPFLLLSGALAAGEGAGGPQAWDSRRCTPLPHGSTRRRRRR